MKQQYIKTFIILGSALTIAAAALTLCLPKYFTLAAALSPAFFTLLSMASIRLMDSPKYLNIRKFTNAVLLLGPAKMLLAAAFIAVSLLLASKPQMIPMAALFLTLYAVFAVLDIKALLKMFREKDSNAKSQK